MNVTNEAGGTALMVAAHAGNIEVVKVLLKCGANLEITNSDGDNALYFAIGKPILYCSRVEVAMTGQYM